MVHCLSERGKPGHTHTHTQHTGVHLPPLPEIPCHSAASVCTFRLWCMLNQLKSFLSLTIKWSLTTLLHPIFISRLHFASAPPQWVQIAISSVAEVGSACPLWQTHTHTRTQKSPWRIVTTCGECLSADNSKYPCLTSPTIQLKLWGIWALLCVSPLAQSAPVWHT